MMVEPEENAADSMLVKVEMLTSQNLDLQVRYIFLLRNGWNERNHLTVSFLFIEYLNSRAILFSLNCLKLPPS